MGRKAEMFIKLNYCASTKERGLFVGPFDTSDKAESQINLALSNNQQIIMGSRTPVDPEKTLRAVIIKKTEARKLGLKVLPNGKYGNNLVKTIPSLERVIRDYKDDIVDAPKHRGRPKKIVIQAATTIRTPATKASISKTPVAKKDVVRDIIMPEISENVENRPVVIIAKYPSTIDWLKQNGISGKIVDHIKNPQEIAGAIVIGMLPYRLASLAYRMGTIDMPGLRAEQRGMPLTVQDMNEAKARLRWYEVRENIASVQ